MLSIIVLVVVVVLILGSIPTWRHSRSWGYKPSAGLAIVLIVVIFFMMSDRHAGSMGMS